MEAMISELGQTIAFGSCQDKQGEEVRGHKKSMKSDILQTNTNKSRTAYLIWTESSKSNSFNLTYLFG